MTGRRKKASAAGGNCAIFGKRKERDSMGEVSAFMAEEDGVAVVEIVLIMLVLIALVLIFKEQITKILKTLMSKVSSESSGV